ncbi:MAG: hypothetical protein R3C53_06755 [Pirellulaceae bacterium]
MTHYAQTRVGGDAFDGFAPSGKNNLRAVGGFRTLNVVNWAFVGVEFTLMPFSRETACFAGWESKHPSSLLADRSLLSSLRLGNAADLQSLVKNGMHCDAVAGTTKLASERVHC